MTDDVRAMHARYDGWCSAPTCGGTIKRGHLMYRVGSHSLCYHCGRAYVDSLPMPPLPARPQERTP